MQVGTISIPDYLDGDSDSFIYPRPGTKNEKFVVKVVEFPRDICQKDGDVSVCIKALNGGLDGSFPWAEYPVRLGWVPASDKVGAHLEHKPCVFAFYPNIRDHEGMCLPRVVLRCQFCG